MPWKRSRACCCVIREQGGEAGVGSTTPQCFNTQVRETNSPSHIHTTAAQSPPARRLRPEPPPWSPPSHLQVTRSSLSDLASPGFSSSDPEARICRTVKTRARDSGIFMFADIRLALSSLLRLEAPSVSVREKHGLTGL